MDSKMLLESCLFGFEMSKKPWFFLGYFGDYTTQVCGDHNKPLYKDPY